MKCSWHLCDNEVVGQRNKMYCSVQCKNKAMVQSARKRQKQKAIDYKGGKCMICGYNKTQEALQFHHLDPSKKDFGLGQKGVTRSWTKVQQELDKCVCLCANCHAEVHAGITIIPE